MSGESKAEIQEPTHSSPRTAGVFAVAVGIVIGAVVLLMRWSSLPARIFVALQAFALACITKAGSNIFWYLALMPGLVAFCYWMMSGRYTHLRSLKRIETFQRDYDFYRGRRTFGDSNPDREAPGTPAGQRMGTRSFLVGSLALCVPFLLVAWLANGNPSQPLGMSYPVVASDAPAPPKEEKAPPPTTAAAPGKATDQKRTSATANPIAAHQGVVLAGYGAYFYVLLLLIFRINATALSPKFLLTTSLRVSLALVFGFLAGLTDLVNWLTSDVQRLVIYAAIGAFPMWAAAALQRKARELFKRPVPGTEPLPIELIDGINDFTADHLTELGITDVQHLATSDPGDLTLRTFYPLERVIEWIDQAILINYLKQHIVEARAVGIRGAIDMRGVYAQATSSAGAAKSKEVAAKSGSEKPMNDHAVCKRILSDLATKSGLSIDVIYNVGASLRDDYHVCLLRDLWHRRAAPAGLREAVEQAVDEALSHPTGKATRDSLEERIDGSFDDGKLTDPQLHGAVKQALDQRLRPFHLEWEGRIEQLAGMHDHDEMKREILDGIQLREGGSR
jgi:hypothetical protein